MQAGVGLAVDAGPQSRGEQSAGFLAADGAAPVADHVAVAGMDFDGRSSVADTEFDDPLRRPRPAAPAVILFGLPPLKGGDLVVDALHPQRVPDPQGVQALQIGRQVIEHIFDSMPMIHLSRPRVFDFLFDIVGCGR